MADNKCYGCKKRKLYCHLSCESYLEYRKKLDEINREARYEYREHDSPYFREGWHIKRRKK